MSKDDLLLRFFNDYVVFKTKKAAEKDLERCLRNARRLKGPMPKGKKQEAGFYLFNVCGAEFVVYDYGVSGFLWMWAPYDPGRQKGFYVSKDSGNTRNDLPMIGEEDEKRQAERTKTQRTHAER